MEKSVPDREEKRRLLDFKSMESLNSRFKGLAFKSWGKLHASFGNKPGLQPCGKLKDVSFDKKRKSRRIEIAQGFQPCGKLKDVSFDKRSRRSKKLELQDRNRMMERFKLQLQERSPRVRFKSEESGESSRSEIFGGGGKLKNASFDKKRESCSTEINERKSSRIQIDERESPRSQIDEEEEEASHESWRSWRRSWRRWMFREVGLCGGNFDKESFLNEALEKWPYESYESYWREMCEWWNSEIDEWRDSAAIDEFVRESTFCENFWKKMLERWGSDIEGCKIRESLPPPESWKSECDEEASQEESWNKIGERSGSEIDKRESWKSEVDEEDKEGLYQTRCWIDVKEVTPDMPELLWRRDLYGDDDDDVDYRKVGRDFKRWRFRVIWGVDGVYPSSGQKMRLIYCRPSSPQERALIYLKWIAKVLGSKQQALDSLVSFTDTDFICQGVSFDLAHLFKRFVNIYAVYPVIYERDVDTKGTPFSVPNEEEKDFYRCKLDEEWSEDPSAISPRYNTYWRIN